MVLLVVLIAQLVVYGLAIWALARILRQFNSVTQYAIFIACLMVGFIGGLLTALLWPRLDSILYPNILAFVIGEQIYAWATATVPPGTPSPHFAVPWPFRIPQLFVFTSIILFALLGLAIQLIANRPQPTQA